MAYTTDSVLEIITSAYRQLTMLDELGVPTAEQSAVGLEVLNDMLTNMDIDGIRLGWYPQTVVTAVAPLQDYDVRNVKVLLASDLAAHYGITVPEDLKPKIELAAKQLAKRSIKYIEADLTGLPFSQGGLFGPGRV